MAFLISSAKQEKSLELTGEVIYILAPTAACSAQGVGIKFSAISKESSELLRNFLEQAASGEAEKRSVATENK